jgi:aminopeptidase YwaD
MKLFTPLLVVVLLYTHTYAQDNRYFKYARNILDSLTTPAMHGRGYVAQGEQIAANFLADQMYRLNLDYFGEHFLQDFPLSANTLPGILSVQLNNKKLKPGYDYLLDPESPSIQGTFRCTWLDTTVLFDTQKLLTALQSAKGQFIAIDETQLNLKNNKKRPADWYQLAQSLKMSPNLPIKGILVLTDSKLTWDASTEQGYQPLVRITKTKAPKKIKNIKINVEATFLPQVTSNNVVGYIRGSRQPDSLIVLTAHYDHLGRMGKNTYFPGANDNASGVAAVLALAKYYTEHPPQYTTVFIAFGGEELGLLGSQYFVANPLFDLTKIKFLINFDIFGTGEEGIQVANGSVHKTRFEQLQKINTQLNAVKEVRIRGEMCKSDHCPFHLKGVPCFYIYTLGGISAYHDVFDRPDTLPLTKMQNLIMLIYTFIETL